LREFAAPFQAGDAPAQLDKRGRDARRPVETVFGLVPTERRMGQFDRRPPSSPRQQQPVQRCPRENAELVWHATEGQSAPGQGYWRPVAGHDRYAAQPGVDQAFDSEGYSPTESSDENRVYQCDKCIPADHKKKGRKTRRPKFMKQPLRLAHMDEECLHPAFVCLSMAIRRRSLMSVLCWKHKRLSFHRIRSRSLSTAGCRQICCDSVATGGAKEVEENGWGLWTYAWQRFAHASFN